MQTSVLSVTNPATYWIRMLSAVSCFSFDTYMEHLTILQYTNILQLSNIKPSSSQQYEISGWSKKKKLFKISSK